MDKSILIDMRKAIKNNDLDKIKYLIENNKGILDEETPFGTFLHDAASYGKTEIVKYFIECGIDVNKNGGARNGSALTEAAFEGKMDIVKILFDNGALLDVSTFPRNPLFAAIANNHFDIAKFLVENGIDLEAHYSIGDLEQVDAYEYARQYGRTEIAEYLKSHSL